jgi:hypothetical protein
MALESSGNFQSADVRSYRPGRKAETLRREAPKARSLSPCSWSLFSSRHSAILRRSSIFPLLSSRPNSPRPSPRSAATGATIEPGRPPRTGRVGRRSVHSQMRRKIMSPITASARGGNKAAPEPGHKKPRRDGTLPHGVMGFQHRRKISSILIRNTVVPLAIRTTPRSCLAIEGVKSPKKSGVVVSIIPLDFQRRCDRRWAARFSRPAESVAPRNERPESQQIAQPDKEQKKPTG